MGDVVALVSVAMATYNGEKYLLEQLESIVSQTYENIELIIVDDCSSDNTREMLRSFNEKHKDKVRVYYNRSNLGLVKNFEKALGYCSGDFIALCDQDDIWELNKIKRLVDEIGEYSLIYSDLSLIGSNGDVLSRSRTSDKRINNHSDISLRELILTNYVIGCSVLFKREILDSVLPIPSDAFLHDWWIAIIASKSNGIKYLHEQLTAYRQHSQNMYGEQDKSFYKKIIQLLTHSAYKSHIFKSKLLGLQSLDSIDGLNIGDRKLILKASNYYKSYLENKLLFRHWILTIILLNKLSVKKSRIKTFIEKITPTK